LYWAQKSYARTYKIGFAKSLNCLGPAPEWYHATADRAELVAYRKAGLLPGDDGKRFTDSGYRITYDPGLLDSDGRVVKYVFSARPIEYGSTGQRSYLMDESGTIHTTQSNRPATGGDPSLPE